MLRSIAIGFAIAALLHFGSASVSSTSPIPLAKAINGISLECESAALGNLISQGWRLLTH